MRWRRKSGTTTLARSRGSNSDSKYWILIEHAASIEGARNRRCRSADARPAQRRLLITTPQRDVVRVIPFYRVETGSCGKATMWARVASDTPAIAPPAGLPDLQGPVAGWRGGGGEICPAAGRGWLTTRWWFWRGRVAYHGARYALLEELGQFRNEMR